jgi:hypothetical protein
MGSILSIAREAADELSLERPTTLFGYDDEGDTGPRRLKRALTRCAKFLSANHEWQVLRREHEFVTVAGEVQPGAIPVDFLRFIGETVHDRTRRLDMRIAKTSQEWQRVKSLQWSQYPGFWMRRGNDMLVLPPIAQNVRMAYEYISDAICIEPASPHAVAYSSNGMTLSPGTRTVVRTTGHTLTIPHLGFGESIELVVEGGTWLNSGANFTTVDGGPIVNNAPIDWRDWISIVRDGARYEVKPLAGHWLTLSVPTTNGMMLQAGRRYIVGQGQLVYVPILARGEQIELLPSTGSWLGHNSRFVTRAGLQIAPPLTDVNLVTLTADMAFTPAYTLADNHATPDPWGYGRRKPEFTSDRDEPLWDDELMIRGIVWMMLHRDGDQYGEDFRAFERMIYDRVKGNDGMSAWRMGARHGEDFALPSHSVVVSDGEVPTWITVP